MAMQWVANKFGGPEVLEARTRELGPPAQGEVTIDVRAAGMNPADFKHIASGQDPSLLPLMLGYEVAGTVAAIGPDTALASGGGAVGDEVVAFQVLGGYATALTVKAEDVFAKPPAVDFAAAANLLLVGSTASEMLHVAGVGANDVVLLHGAAGAVGTSVLQQARLLGADVVGTASTDDFDHVRHYGGIPVEYGPGLEDRVREAAPKGVTAALDTVGSDEAVDVSLDLVADRGRVVTIAAFGRAKKDGIMLLGASNPSSGPYRASQRARLLQLAGEGKLEVPIAATYPIDQAPVALAALMGHHPYGKLALVG